MNKIVNINFQEKIINELLRENNHLVILIGKSGSGKSVILQKLIKNERYVLLDKLINNLKDFQDFINRYKSKNVIFLIDELAFYKEEILDQIRIYSDELKFILTSHKDLILLNKEHFKTRVNKKIFLSFLNLKELKKYLKDKFDLNCFLDKDLKFILKLSRKNIRNIDKLAISFIKIRNFYNENNINKTNKFILNLSAIENELMS